MADPLSVAGSIAGLLSLAEVAFSKTYKFYQAFSSAPKEIKDLFESIQSLHAALSTLTLRAANLENDAEEHAFRGEHVYQCYKTLEEINASLDKLKINEDKCWHADTIKKKLKWPFKREETLALVTRLDQHKQTLTLALTADTHSSLLTLLSTQEKLNSELEQLSQETRRLAEHEEWIFRDRKRKRMITSLGTHDYKSPHKRNRKLWQPGTGQWLLESPEFTAWITTLNSTLWIYSIPGAGKTVLASLIIEECLKFQRTNIAVAYFYCDYKESSTKRPDVVLGSLTKQLVLQSSEAFKKFEKSCSRRSSDEADTAYESSELAEMLGMLSSAFSSTMLIIDGIDECDDASADIIDLLLEASAIEGSTLKIVLLSRDEMQIRERG